MIHLLAQVDASWIGPGAQVGATGVLAMFMHWLMKSLIPKIDAMKRSMDLNTKGTMLAALANDEISGTLRAKLKEALDELRELQGKPKDDGGVE